jgi:hypothetical protein
MEWMRSSSSGFVIGVVLIAAGAGLLLVQFLGGAMGSLWPFFIILPGVVLLVAAARSNWPSSLAIAGAIVATVGMILFVQDLIDYYRSWAYAWALLPAAAGAAMLYSGQRQHDVSRQARGRSLLQWSLAGFVVLGALFELVIFEGGTMWGRIAVPLILIAVGGVVLLRRGSRTVKDEVRPSADPATTNAEHT